jgi:DNA-directed RNA polymerase specialized sigma24 family protein
MRNRALEELREGTRLDRRTVRAFEMVVFEERAPADVASRLAVSVDSVYAAKHRCARRLRAIVSRLRELYEMD